MARRAGLCATVVVAGSSLLWLLLVAGIMTGPAQAYRGSAVSVQVAATVSPQATPTQTTSTKGKPTKQGASVQNDQVRTWVMLSLLVVGCAVVLTFVGFMLWFGGLLPWHRREQQVRFVSRGRERAWLLLGAVVFVGVLWAIAPVLGWPVWARVVLTGLAAALPWIVPELRARGAQDDTRVRLV